MIPLRANQINQAVENHNTIRSYLSILPLTMPLWYMKCDYPSAGKITATPAQLYTIFHSWNDLLQEKIRCSIVSTPLPHNTHKTLSTSWMIPLFHRFNLEGALSSISCQPNALIFKGIIRFQNFLKNSSVIGLVGSNISIWLWISTL